VTDDYQRIAKAVDFIRNNVGHQPSLAQIAAQVHLSEYHFQRLFSRWAGVTPKRYLQVLTLERAKSLLANRQLPTLSASYEVGLTSGSRLYDHFVQIEAVTPSEFKHRGGGLSIDYGYHPSPYGQLFVARTARGICQLDFVDENNADRPLLDLRANWCNAIIQEDATRTAPIVDALFSLAPTKTTPLSLWVRGTNFQLNVWRALLNIPQGLVASYKEIAHSIGKPSATRAVGTAIGANPIALLIPCHRVLRQTGELGGYRWGENRKHAILTREAALCD
jgi:AraC family transcriptional regulator, regulatory protein of adaptative response / methylated-DNA-[protein]-cysteine methyltransferase